MVAFVVTPMYSMPMHKTATQLYRHYGKYDQLLYVGISLNTMQRLMQHLYGSHWIKEVVRIDIAHYDTRDEALQAETLAIHNENPAHNIAKVKKVGPESMVEPESYDYHTHFNAEKLTDAISDTGIISFLEFAKTPKASQVFG